MFNVISSSVMNNFTSVQELSRTPENTFKDKKMIFKDKGNSHLTANSREVLGAQGCLAT